MKYLLTSAGLKNDSIQNALTDLLGKPISQANALVIPTACYQRPGGFVRSYRFIAGIEQTPLTEFGWKTLGVLELTALQSIGKDIWLPQVQQTDAILVAGGDPMFLNHWMTHSGFAAEMADLPSQLVYVGISAGSMVMAPRIGPEFVNWVAPSGNDISQGRVGFSIFPHLGHPMLPENTLEEAEKWAANLNTPAYAIDDETAIQVVGDDVRVISQGTWQRFDPK